MASGARIEIDEYYGDPMSFQDPARPAPKFQKVPKHIAIVMDGNGRWANQRGLPRTEGHKAGEQALLEVVSGALEIGVEAVSAFAFSTENWKRDPEEVRFLMGFNRDVLRRRREQLIDWQVRVVWSGSEKRLWKSVIRELRESEQMTSHLRKMTLNMCVNYGGRTEIVEATKRLAKQVKNSELDPDRITQKTIAGALYQPSLPDVDLFIRSSGEQRISNFLPWQASYAEMVFSETLWPDFTRETLWDAVDVFQSRDRRFGSAKDTPGQG